MASTHICNFTGFRLFSPAARPYDPKLILVADNEMKNPNMEKLMIFITVIF
jgi:hypothetical protein